MFSYTITWSAHSCIEHLAGGYVTVYYGIYTTQAQVYLTQARLKM